MSIFKENDFSFFLTLYHCFFINLFIQQTVIKFFVPIIMLKWWIKEHLYQGVNSLH